MKIYYRGYLINENPLAWSGCVVHGTRPERLTLTTEENSRSAMQWIDRDVIRQKVEAAGWFSPQALRV